jgi:hypothetical protein
MPHLGVSRLPRFRRLSWGRFCSLPFRQQLYKSISLGGDQIYEDATLIDMVVLACDKSMLHKFVEMAQSGCRSHPGANAESRYGEPLLVPFRGEKIKKHIPSWITKNWRTESLITKNSKASIYMSPSANICVAILVCCHPS